MQAYSCYLEALRIQPTFAIAWSNLAGLFMESGDFNRALQYYKVCLFFTSHAWVKFLKHLIEAFCAPDYPVNFVACSSDFILMIVVYLQKWLKKCIFLMSPSNIPLFATCPWNPDVAEIFCRWCWSFICVTYMFSFYFCS